MYILKTDYDPLQAEHKGGWSVSFPFKGAEYVSWFDPEEYYDLCEQHYQKCPKFYGAAEIIPDFEEKLSFGEFKCAEYDSGSLELSDTII